MFGWQSLLAAGEQEVASIAGSAVGAAVGLLEMKLNCLLCSW